MKEKEVDIYVREMIKKQGYTNQERFVMQDEASNLIEIKEILSKSSKLETNNIGFPDDLVFVKESNTIIVFENKSGMKNHKSHNGKKYSKKAIDGTLWYAEKLKNKFNVIAIAVSMDEQNKKIDTYYWKQNNEMYFDLKIDQIEAYDTYANKIKKKFQNSNTHSDKEKILRIASNKLNNDMRDYLEILEENRAALAAAILISLNDTMFKLGYPELHSSQEVASTIYDIVINNENVQALDAKERKAIKSSLSFIETIKDNDKGGKEYMGNSLKRIVDTIRDEVYVYFKTSEFDLVGLFFTSFLKYATKGGGDLGVVLTPDHIADLFTRLASINKDSKVLDPTMGTGTFLVKSWLKIHEDNNLFKNDDINIDAIENNHIRKTSLGGVEIKPSMFALAYMNFILAGDGKNKFILGSFLEEKIKKELENKFNVGFINPPYSHGSASELKYVLNMLDVLKPGSIGVAIIPVNAVANQSKKHGNLNFIKETIFKKHKLIASIQMPIDLFYPKGTETVILVFKTRQEHNGTTWFAKYNDGFKVMKQKGRVPIEDIQKKQDDLINAYKNYSKTEFSFNKEVSHEQQWVYAVQKDMAISFNEEDLKETIKDYTAFKFLNEYE